MIGASGASASDTVPLAVMKLLERMPQARVKLVEGTTDRLLEQLAQGGLDIVVGRSAPEHHDPAIRYEALYLEPIHGGAAAPSAVRRRAAGLAAAAVVPLDPVAQGHAHPQCAGRRAGRRRPSRQPTTWNPIR